MPSFRRLLFLIALGIAGAWFVRTHLYEGVSVESASMEPTLFVGVHYMVNRWVYRFESPKRGDIISLVNPVDNQSLYIKRIIALPGDIVEMKNKRVVLNGQPLSEPYAIYKRAGEALDGDNLGPLTVPPSHVFVLGDNRDFSLDSTSWFDSQTKKHIYFLPFKNIRGRLINPVAH